MYKNGAKCICESIDPRQLAQSAQADMGRNFSPSLKFSVCRRTILHHDSVASLTNWIFMDAYLGNGFARGVMDQGVALSSLLTEHGSYVLVHEQCSLKKGINAFVENIDPGNCAQTDTGRNFSCH